MDNKEIPITQSVLVGLQIEICKDLVCEELDGEMVILNMQSGLYFGIDEIGSRIWKMLEEKIPPVTMIKLLLDEYEIEADLCRQQVMAFIMELEKNNLIMRIPV